MERFAEIVADQPEVAGLVVIDSLSLGAAAIPARDAAAARFETMLRQSLAEAGGGGVDEVTARALVGGVRRIVYRELRAGRPQALRGEVDALVEWAIGYREGGAPAAAVVPARAGGGAGEAARDDGAVDLSWEEPPAGDAARAALSQRERIVRGTAIAVTERGYGATSIEAIRIAAGVSKESFYAHFESKLDAFLAAYDALAARTRVVATGAFAAQEDWSAGIAAGIAALLEHIVADRLYARLSFFELPAAGPAALDRADAALQAFTAFLDPEAFGASTPRRPPPVVIEAICGGLWAAIQHEIAAGRTASLPRLAPTLSRVVLAPFG
jgi:AcrR family transcriptional regulator